LLYNVIAAESIPRFRSLGALWPGAAIAPLASGGGTLFVVLLHRREDFSRGYNFGERNGPADYLRKCEEAFNSV
jgi:hypothetical protein